MATDKEELENTKKLLEEIGVIRLQIEEHLKAAETIRTKADEQAALIAQIKIKSEEQLKAAEASRLKSEEQMKAAEVSRIKSEEQLKATEASRKKADDDASYANQAKINCEEHSKAAAVFKGSSESDMNSIATSKLKSDELLAALARGKADIDADKKIISEHRKEIDTATKELLDTAKNGATSLEEITETKETSITLKAEIEGKRDDVIEANDLATTARIEAQNSAEKVNALEKKVSIAHTTITEQSDEINDLSAKAKTEKEELSEILTHLEKSEIIANGYETRLTKGSTDLEALIARATSLLPGFASASLASSFNDQKMRFEKPQKQWLKIFSWCIGGLALVALPSFILALCDGSQPDEWGPIFRSMAMRLPIVIPLVWFAVLAGRNYMSAVRLEEDYAYKEALSKAFEGYKREMKEIPAEDASKNPSPINTLCINILTAIAERPGRIYDGKHPDITPLNEALSASNEIRKKHVAKN